jgi:hypothetical protein
MTLTSAALRKTGSFIRRRRVDVKTGRLEVITGKRQA